jgi:hypothetical protein
MPAKEPVDVAVGEINGFVAVAAGDFLDAISCSVNSENVLGYPARWALYPIVNMVSPFFGID